MLLITKIILFSAIIFDLILLLFVLKNNRNIVNKLLAINILGILGWAICIFLNLWFSSLIIERLIFVFPIIIVISQMFFIEAFPHGKNIINFNRKIILFLSAFFVAICFIPNSLFSKIEISNQGYTILDSGFWTPFYSLFILIFISYPIIVLLKKYKKNNEKIIVKMQLKYLFFGYLIFLVASYLTNLVLPVFFEVYIFNGLGPALSLIFSGFIFFIITRYDFLEIRLIIQKSLLFSFVISLILSIYLVLLSVIGYFFQQLADLTSIVAAFFTTVVSIYSVPIVEKYILHKTNNIFFKDKYEYSEVIFDLSEALNKNINLEKLLKEISVKFKRIFKIDYLIIILPTRKIYLNKDGVIKNNLTKEMENYFCKKDNNYFLPSDLTDIFLANKMPGNQATKKGEIRFLPRGDEKYDVGAVVPIRLDDELIGVIVMGEKLSGDLYSSEDCNLLKTFSRLAAVALEKSQLYENAKNYSSELEKRVAERIAEIKSLQEEQKQMMLEIAHGLQTPLTIIKGEMGILGRQVKDKKNLVVLDRTIDRISKFIYDMLRLARMENRVSDLKKERFNLSDLVLELAESFEIICQDKNIQIRQIIEPGIYFFGRKEEIAELISNLASNSVKYMSVDRDRTILLVLKQENDRIRISLSDTGIGIDNKYINNIFSRFFRINDEDHTTKSGTGLGLAICKEIVGRHGGEITVESKKDQGTKFDIYFPVKNIVSHGYQKK